MEYSSRCVLHTAFIGSAQHGCQLVVIWQYARPGSGLRLKIVHWGICDFPLSKCFDLDRELGRRERRPSLVVTAHLFVHGDKEGEAKGVLELDFVGERLADLFGGGRRVDGQADGAAVHQRHRNHYRLLGLGRLSPPRGERSCDQAGKDHV